MPLTGHAVDANTIALWRFDEASGDAPDVSGNGYTLTAQNAPGTMAGQVGNARTIAGTGNTSGSGQHFTRSGDLTLKPKLGGDITIEGWLYLAANYASVAADPYPCLVYFGDASATRMFSVCIERATRRLYFAHHDAGGVGREVIFNGALALTTWTHVAVVRTLVGGVWHMKLYLNGVFIEDQTLPGPGTVISLDGTLAVGRIAPNFAYYWPGGVDDLRLSKVARSAAEISASFASGSSAGARVGATIDSATLALWRADETGTGNLLDAVGSYPLTAFGSPLPVAGQIGLARSTNGSNQWFEGAGNTAAVNALLAEWTFEFWANPGALTASVVIFEYGHIADSLITNHLMQIGMTAAGALTMAFERSTGSSANTDLASSLSGFLVAGQWHHYAITKKLNGSTYDVSFYKDGAIVTTTGGMRNAEGGTSSFWSLGRHAGGAAGTYANVAVDDIRWSNRVRSSAEILATYNAGIQTAAAWTLVPDVVPPSVSFTPALFIPESNPYGTDYSTLPGLDASMALIGGDRVLQEALLRRLMTPRGALEFHPEYGLDVRRFLSARMDAGSLDSISTAIEGELEQDERVTSATVSTTWDPAARVLYLDISAETAEGPFELNISLSASGQLQVS